MEFVAHAYVVFSFIAWNVLLGSLAALYLAEAYQKFRKVPMEPTDIVNREFEKITRQ